MNAPLTLTLRVDSAQATKLAAALRSELERAPQWLLWLAAEAFENLDQLFELLPVDGEGVPAADAGDLRILAQPTDQLVRLLAAVRAGNGEAGAWVELELHGGPHA